MKPNFDVFYNPYNTLTHNALLNFLIGNRGSGKTWGMKYRGVDNFKKTGEQFIYLRRYSKELNTTKNFFGDLKDFFPDDDLVVKGKEFFVNDKKAGQAMALSTSKIEKSSTFPDVSLIIFDEFIIDKGVYRYLPNEVEYFLEFYETIARMREVRVFFMANAITQTNPYFLYFNIELPYGKTYQHFFNDGTGQFTKKRNKPSPDLLIELVANEHYIDKKSQTRFGQLIKGTNYYDYAVENTFLRDSNDFIEKKGEGARFRFSIVYTDSILGIWIDISKGLYYVSQDTDPSSKIVYSFTKDDHSINTMLISTISTSPLLKRFFDNFKLGNVRFENVNTKNIFYDLLSKARI